MYKKTIAYTDYNGEQREEDFFFNISKAELVMLQYSEHSGFASMLKKILNDRDGPAIMENFKKIIHLSYGEKSGDGRSFIKKGPDGKDLADKFEETEAYSELFMLLISNPEEASKFINSVLPADLVESAKQESGNITQLPADLVGGTNS